MVGGFGRVRRVAAAGALVGCHLVSTSTFVSVSTSGMVPARHGRPLALESTVASPATVVAALTGPGSINDTDTRGLVKGTDLGIMWQSDSGAVLAAFGDTFGTGWTGHGSAGTPAADDWRSNTLARSRDQHLADGMTLRFVEDDPGHARELLASKKVDADEITVIPTAGVAVGRRNYVHYMSVRQWVSHGVWTTNYAGVAYSDDDGETWVKDPEARWPNEAGAGDTFQMTAYARSEGFVYVFGTPSGRGGDVRLARVPEDRLLSPQAYRYWDGSDWSPDISAAVPVVAAPVGEMSVQYNAYLERWTMMYVHDPAAAPGAPGAGGDVLRAAVLRTAARPTGPWSRAEVVATSADYPGLYAPFIHPWSAGSGDQDLYFTLSLWDPYGVQLMKTTLGGPA